MAVERSARGFDAFDEIRLVVDSAIGERLCPRGHVERTHLVGTGSKAGVRTNRLSFENALAGVQIGILGQSIRGVDHSVESDHERQSRVGAVDREPGHLLDWAERSTHTRLDDERVAWIVGVGQNTGPDSIEKVVVLNTRFHRCRKDEDLDARAGLPGGECKVDFVATAFEGAASHHGAYCTGLGVEGDNGRLDPCCVGRQLRGFRVFGSHLHLGVESRVHPQTTSKQTVVALFVRIAEYVAAVEEERFHFFAEVSTGDRLLRSRLHEFWDLPAPLATSFQVFLFRRRVGLAGHQALDHRIGLVAGHEFLGDHGIEHFHEPPSTRFGPTNRVVTGGSLDHPGKERSFQKCEILYGLAEVHLGGGLDAIRIVAEIDGVEIPLENLLLRAFLLEAQCVDDLEEFVSAVAFESRQIIDLHDLLCDGGCALASSSFEVRQRRTEQTADVHTLVSIEPAIFDGKNCGDDVVGHLVDRHRLRVLQFVDRNFVAVAVVHVGALGDVLDRWERHRRLVVGVRQLPHPRRHSDDDGRQQQGPSHDEQGHSNRPIHHSHGAPTVPVGSSADRSPISVGL